jgi:hypothetical protein
MTKQPENVLNEAGAVDLQALEQQIISAPDRPPVTRLISSRQSDVELAEGFKKRMLANLAEQAFIWDEMKAAGPFGCTFQWGCDASGHHFIASMQMTRIYT